MVNNLNYKDALRRLKALENKSKAKVYQNFFKTGKGQYGEGDKFLGLSAPQVQTLSEEFTDISLDEVLKLLKGGFHEERALAMRVLVNKFKKSSEKQKKEIAKFYLKNSKSINNWDLVDVSAYKILGPYAEMVGTDFLFDLAKSDNLWQRRISIISTFYFINKKEFSLTFEISKILLGDREDLMHKAVGWMLREVGKKCGEQIEETFLIENYDKIQRTTLRYAIEHFEEGKRKKFLLGDVKK